MNKDQREYLRQNLGPGIAVVKDPRYPHPFLINVPMLNLPQDVSDDKVLEHLSKRAHDLYHPSEVTQLKEAIRMHRGIPAEAVALLPSRNAPGDQPEHKVNNESRPGSSSASARGKSFAGSDRGIPGNRRTTSAAGFGSGTSSLSDRARRVCTVWLNLEYPFLTEGEIFAKAGVTAGSMKGQIKKELVRMGMIVEHELQCGKGRINVWEPTDKLWSELG
jgi:hypothetical protein